MGEKEKDREREKRVPLRNQDMLDKKIFLRNISTAAQGPGFSSSLVAVEILSTPSFWLPVKFRQSKASRSLHLKLSGYRTAGENIKSNNVGL